MTKNGQGSEPEHRSREPMTDHQRDMLQAIILDKVQRIPDADIRKLYGLASDILDKLNRKKK